MAVTRTLYRDPVGKRESHRLVASGGRPQLAGHGGGSNYTPKRFDDTEAEMKDISMLLSQLA